MEKAYDQVNRKKLFEVMRCYGVQKNLLIDGSMGNFELENVTT